MKYETKHTVAQQATSRWDSWVGISLTLGALALYTFTLAPTVLEADGGEFQFVPWLPGIAHPTGYPLYTLLGWLWSHLFFAGEVAWRMNLLSAIFAAVVVGLTYGAGRHLLSLVLTETPRAAQISAAAMTALTFAISRTFWSQALIAEVYTLHALFVTLIVWLALRLGTQLETTGQPTPSLTLLLAFLFGLGLTHHRTIILLLPAVVLFLFLSAGHLTKIIPFTPKSIVTHAIVFVAPLLLYLYLPVVAPFTPYATLSLSPSQTLILYDNSLAGFWDHINAAVFTGEIQPAAIGPDRFFLVGQLLLQQVGWPGVALALAGLITLWQRRQIRLLWLTGLGSLTFTAFNLIYFIGDVYVLFIPVWWMVCLWIGVGALGLAHGLAQHFVQRKLSAGGKAQTAFANIEQRLGKRAYQFSVIGLLALWFVVTLLPLFLQNIDVNRRDHTTARDRWQKILSMPLPNGAVLISNDRNEIMPMWYYQYVEGRRPDLLGLFPLIVSDPAYATVGGVLEQALASRRPVYLIKPMDGLSLKADLTPVETLYQATSLSLSPTYTVEKLLPEISFTTADGATYTETIKLIGYDVSTKPVPVQPGSSVNITLYWQPIQALSTQYTSYVHLVNNQGQGVAQSDHRPGGIYYPSSLWQPGKTLRDQHTITLPPGIPPGNYTVRAGMYTQPEPGLIRGMGNGLEIGLLEVTSE